MTIEHQRKSILDLTHKNARTFLLKPESYCSLELPSYIVFGDLINGVHKVLDGKNLKDFEQCPPRGHDGVNYTILHNKDGKYAWRSFQLIHPALYVSLVHAITEEKNWTLILARFKEFSNKKMIRCLSLPVVSFSDEKDKAEQVSNWWRKVELKSIELSLDYDYLIETDIADCYGSIYTHSIAWALHGKPIAKKNRTNKNLIGNVIDSHIQDMRQGQTNGIPQGSVLMDFIAEMVLGLADLELSNHLQKAGIKIEDYQILRYRDDYRIFVNSPQVGEAIAKWITQTTSDLGLKLNPAKTKASNDVVRASIKSDKLAWMARKQSEKGLLKHLLIIHDHATNFPNTGSLIKALEDYCKCIKKPRFENPLPLIAIVVNIAYRNPRTFPICVTILSKLLDLIDTITEKSAIVKRIGKRFSKIPNNGHLLIWLQRMTIGLDRDIDYDEIVCKLVVGKPKQLWNNEWILCQDLKDAVDATKIVDAKSVKIAPKIIPLKEVGLFFSKAGEGYY